ncbi:MAG: hypothetical protein EXS17_07310 [Phycisphaerales bacterium]|nr:hypothetical protein [Phycisphaerales bacterium]
MSFFSFQDIMACVTGIMILVALILALDPLGDIPTSARNPGQSQQLRQGLDGARARVAEAQKGLEAASAALAEAKARPQVSADQLERLEKLVAKAREGVIAIERLRDSANGDAQRQEDQTVLINRDCERASEKVLAIKQDLGDKSLRARVQYQAGDREQLRPLLFEVTPTEIRVGELDEMGTPKQVATVRDASVTTALRVWAASTPVAGAAPEAIALEPLLRSHPSSNWYVMLIVRDDSVTLSNGLRDLVRAQGYEIGWQIWDAHDGGFFDLPPESLP